MASKALLRGVGAGLQRFSQRRREDRRLEKEDAFKERELQIRENESRLRQQQIEIQNIASKAKIAHGNLVKTAMSSGYTDQNAGYGSQPLAEAMTKYLGDGRAYRHKGYNDKGLPEWEIGRYKTDLETGKVTQDSAGKPEWIPYKDIDGRDLTKSFGTADEWVSFINSNMNPDYMFALQAEKRTADQAEQAHKDSLRRMVETKAKELETKQGETAQKAAEQDIKESEARTRKLDKEAQATGGKSSKIQQMGMKEFAKDLRKRFPDSTISMDTAEKIAESVDNPRVREHISNLIARTFDPSDPDRLTRTQVIKDGVAAGYPKEYLDSLFDEAQAILEEDEEAARKPGWGARLMSLFD